MAETLASLDPEVRPLFAGWLQDLQRAGVPFRVTSLRRSAERQAQLYAEWRAGRARYPVAPPGTSTHEYGFAADVVVPPALLPRAVALARAWGIVWFGPRDAVHWDPFGPALWRRLVRGLPAD